MTVLWLRQDLNGSILDVGGGGEGVIGRLYGQSVTAIDNCREELDEAPCGCRKLVMDASALSFADASFENVTFFYSLMYMDRPTQRAALPGKRTRPSSFPSPARSRRCWMNMSSDRTRPRLPCP